MKKLSTSTIFKLLLVTVMALSGALLPACSCSTDPAGETFQARDEYVRLYNSGGLAIDIAQLSAFDAATQTQITVGDPQFVAWQYTATEKTAGQFNTTNRDDLRVYHYSERMHTANSSGATLFQPYIVRFFGGKAYYGDQLVSGLQFSAVFAELSEHHFKEVRIFDPAYIDSFEGSNVDGKRTVTASVKTANVADVYDWLCEFSANITHYKTIFNMDFAKEDCLPTATITIESTATHLVSKSLTLSAYDARLKTRVTFVADSHYSVSAVEVITTLPSQDAD